MQFQLLDAGADLKARTTEGATPIVMAAQGAGPGAPSELQEGGAAKCIEYLLDAGVDQTERDEVGKPREREATQVFSPSLPPSRMPRFTSPSTVGLAAAQSRCRPLTVHTAVHAPASKRLRGNNGGSVSLHHI